MLTLSPPSTTVVPYANSLDLDETPSNFKLFDTQTTFSPTLSNIGALRKLKQTRNLADDNLFAGLKVKDIGSITRILFIFNMIKSLNPLNAGYFSKNRF